MKNLLTATLPALALLALGGCATSGALTSTTESDGVYYSSADKTTATSNLNSVYANRGYNQSTAGSANPDGFAYNRPTDVTGTAPATTDDANPDYVAGAGTATEGYNTSTLGGSTDYYANSLSNNASGFGVPYTGPGVSSYNYAPAVSPYSSFYGSPFGYGMGLGLGLGYGGFGGFGYPYGGLYSPYAYSGFYDPFYSSFYSPFYSPFGFGYGSGLALGFGYGGFGYPFGGYYGGGYGRGYYGDYYGGGFYNRPAIYTGRTNAPTPGAVLVGGRPSRGGAVMGNAIAPSNPTMISPGRGNAVTGSAAPIGNPTNGGYNGPVGTNGRAVTFGGAQPTAAPAVSPNVNAGQPQAGQPSRRGFFSGFFGNGANPGNVSGGQPASAGGNYGGGNYGGGRSRERSSMGQMSQMGQPGGGFSQPQQRSYSQPQQRSFSQPQFSQPQPARSFGGGGGSFGGGGGSFGGGGGGRGRR